MLKKLYLLIALIVLTNQTLIAQCAGNSLLFNGISVNDRVDADYISSVANNFTIEFWANPSKAIASSMGESTGGFTGVSGQNYAIFPNHGTVTGEAGAGISVGTNGVAVIEHAASYIPALLVYYAPISGWTHIAVVYTNRQPSLYINGVLVKTGITSPWGIVRPSSSISAPVYGPYSGSIDELRIWNKSLSPATIAAWYNKAGTSAHPDYAFVNRIWHMDETSGNTLTDATANNNIGTLANSPQRQASGAIFNCPQPATALNFDGVNDRVVVSNSAVDLANRSFSVEMWLKRGTPGTTDIAFFQGGNVTNNTSLHIGFRDNGNFTFAFYNNDLDVVGLSDALWHHWACSYDNTTRIQRVYRDGVLVGQRTSTSNFLGSGNTNLIIGDAAFVASNGPTFFNGTIDEVRVWGRALCATEINTYRNASLPFTSGNNLLAYYKLDQGFIGSDNPAVNSAHDEVTNTNNGTLNNFTLTGATSNWVAGTVTGTASAYVAPIPTISASGPLTFCAGASVTLTASAGASYLWSNGATTQSISTTQAGNYSVTVKDAAGCSGTSAETTVSTTVCAPPVITSFTPLSGAVGTTVTITGNNFDAVPQNNTVYIGGVKVPVVSGSSSSLSIVIPAGLSNAPITVTVPYGLSATSGASFNTVAPCNGDITTSSFEAPVVVKSTTYYSYGVATGDLNGDGKQDLVNVNFYGTINVFKNIASPGSITTASFASPLTIANSNGSYNVRLGDIDGDGKPDIVITGNGGVFVHRNTSSGGNLSFAAYVQISTGAGANDLVLADLNRDGKIDIVTAPYNYSGQAGNMVLIQNNSIPGNLSLATPVQIINVPSMSNFYGKIEAGDLDGDGYADLVLAAYNGPFVYVYRNNAVQGNITTGSLSNYITVQSGIHTSVTALADMNDDGKLDIIASGYGGLALITNSSNPGDMQFGSPTILNSNYSANDLEAVDINGDGKTDIAGFGGSVFVMQRLSGASTFAAPVSFAVPYPYASYYGPRNLAVADLDGDGMTDVFAGAYNYDQANISYLPVLRNALAKPLAQTITAAGSTTFCEGGSVVLSVPKASNVTYQWKLNGSSIGDNSNQLTAVASGTYTVEMSNPCGTTVSLNSIAVMANAPPAIPVITYSGQPTVCEGASVSLTSSSATSYQWKRNGVAITGAVNQSFMATISGNYSVTVPNSFGCTATSEPVQVTVNPKPLVAVTPATTTICAGSQLVLSASEVTTITKTYNVAASDLLNMFQNCGNGSLYGIDGIGFKWNDAGTGNVSSVEIKFAPGVECQSNTTHTTILNGVTGESFTSLSFCSCSLRSGIVTINPSNQAYIVGGTNTLIFGNVSTWFGLNPNQALNNSYATITVTYSNPSSGNISWLWPSTSETTNNITVTPTANTNYTVTATNEFGCSVNASAVINTYTPAAVTVSATGATSVCPGSTVQLTTAAVAGSASMKSYQWLLNGQPLQGATANGLLAAASGTYSVVVTSNNDCTSTSNGISVLVEDLLSPEVYTRPLTVYLDHNGHAIITTSQVNNNSTDNCGIGSYSVSKSEFDCSNRGDNIIELTVTDVNGHSASATAVVTVIDNEVPEISLAFASGSFEISDDGTGNCTTTVNLGTPTTRDNCTVTATKAFVNGEEINPATYAFPIGTTTVSWIVTDGSGHTATINQVIKVVDDEAPLITAPGAVNLSCQDDTSPASTGTATGNDNCSSAPITYSDESTQTASGINHYNYTIARTWTATDVTGNHSEATQNITVTDGTAPVLAGVPVSTNASCDNIPAAAQLTATDNCDGNPVVSLLETSTQTATGVGHYNYTITRTWTATDVTGNHSSASQTITVTDATAPVLAGVPANANASCDNIPSPAQPTATDNCDGSPVVSLLETSTQTATGVGHYNYTITRTWTATDVTGNHSSASQIITVTDATAPVLAAVPVNANASCDNIPPAAQPTATDNCDGSPVVSLVETSTQTATGIAHYNYTITRTWTATDVTGNHSSASQTITITDATAPVLAGVPAAANASCDNIPTAAQPTAMDNCDGSPVVTLLETSTQTANGIGQYNYTITRTWTATDVTGNHSEASQTIAITDATAPVLVGIPDNANASCDNIPPAAQPTATDNCDANPVVSLSETSTQTTTGVGHYNYIITRTWTATDVTGNHSEASQTITVTDATAPVLAGVPTNTNASCDNIPTAAQPTATDNCDGSPVASLSETSTQTASGVGHYNYTITRTWTATDVTGNHSEASQTITVSDATAPVLAGVPANTNASCDNIPSAAQPTATDNCDGSPVVSLVETSTQTSSGVGHYNYTITRTWTATDVTGNHSSASQTITVTDGIAPVLAGVPDNANASCDNVPIAAQPTATDNCDGSPVVSLVETSTQTASHVGHYNYTITRTWTATDVTGNHSSASQTLTVTDATAPVLAGIPANANASCDNIPPAAQPTATDNCDGSPVVSLLGTSTQTANGVSHYNYTITRTWTATDVTGNHSSASQIITVKDQVAPTAICKSVTVSLINGIATITAADVNNGSFDNCSPVTLSLSKRSFNCTAIGSNTVTLTVKDVSGNSSTCSVTVNVIGEVPACNISSVPSNSVYTGGVATSLFIGYGPQSTTLKVNTPASGAPYTYLWTGNGLSSYNTANPVFTASNAGSFTFTVLVTNKFGCTTSCSLTICVTDVRVMDKKGEFTGKVFVCHLPDGSSGQTQTLEISPTAVPTHLTSHAGDRLGSCNMAPCGTLLKNNYVQEANPAKNLNMVVAPNPSISSFKIKLISNSVEPIYLKVINAKGQAFERAEKLYSGSTITLGAKWIGGTYFVEALQGGQRKIVRLVKLN